MDGPQRLELVDDVAGETVQVDGGGTVAELIDRRLAAADHPRADFRARPLAFTLRDETGDVLAPDATAPSMGTVTLTCPDAADVVERRDRWLADIESTGTATVSVSSSTHLALVERTGSRIDDVVRLRAQLAERRPPPPPPPGLVTRGRVVAAVATVALVAVAGGVLWALIGPDGGSDTAAGSGARGGFAEEEAEPALGPVVATTVAFAPARGVAIAEEVAIEEGFGGVGCALLDPVDIEPPFATETAVSCELAVYGFEVGPDGTTVEISATSVAADPIVWLYDEDGSEIAFNDDTNGLNSLIVVDLSEGRYEIHLGNLTGQADPIELVVEIV